MMKINYSFEQQLELIKLHPDPGSLIDRIFAGEISFNSDPTTIETKRTSAKHYTSEDNEMIIRLYQEDKSTEEIADALGRTPRGINDQVIKLRKQYPDRLPIKEGYGQLGFARWVAQNPNATDEEKETKREELWPESVQTSKPTVQAELDTARFEKRLEGTNVN